MDTLKSAWQEIKEELQNKKKQIYEEIGNYPPPIPACDQQFNYLLEERTRISQELRQIDTISQESLACKNPVEVLEGYLQSSSYISDETEQKIRNYLKGVSNQK